MAPFADLTVNVLPTFLDRQSERLATPQLLLFSGSLNSMRSQMPVSLSVLDTLTPYTLLPTFDAICRNSNLAVSLLQNQ